MGTEERRSGDQAVEPSNCSYEFIIFRAVNVRELWLDEGNGRRRDLIDEIINPLKNGQLAMRKPQVLPIRTTKYNYPYNDII